MPSDPTKPTSSLPAFFLLTYAVTWICFVPLAATGTSPHSVPGTLLVILGVFSPTLAALSLVARAEGGAGVRALLGRVVEWKVSPRWCLFAVGYMAAIKLTAALLHRVATGAWPRFGNEAWYVMAVAVVFSTPVQAGEEIGWRGYALPRLAARFGLAPASVILGVIWACWHLPLFFVPEADTYHQSFPVYLLQVTALSVAIAWLYAHTKGSLLPAMLLHAAINNTKDIVPSAVPGATSAFAWSASLVGWLTLGLLWACAAYFLVRMPRMEPARA